MSERLLAFIRANVVDTNHYMNIFEPLIDFFSQLEVQKTLDNVTQVGMSRVRVYELRLIISIINDVYNQLPFINIEDLVDILNHDFDFFVTDFCSVFGVETQDIIQQKTHVNPCKIRDTRDIQKLLKFSDLSGYLMFEPHMLVVKYSLLQQLNQDIELKCSIKRKLHAFDFQQVCYQRMNIASIMRVCQFYTTQNIHGDNIDSLGIFMMIEYLAEKLARQTKLFIVDHTHLTKEQFEPKMFEHVDVIEELRRAYNQTKMLTQKYMPFAESPILQLLKVIEQELVLIEHIVKFNILCLDKQFKDASEYMLRFVSSATITEHQICLLAQTIHSQMQTNTRLTQNMRDIFEQLLTANNRIKNCDLYFDNKLRVKCQHKTFSFYSVFKWYQAFIKLIDKYMYNSQGFVQNVSPAEYAKLHDRFLDPKISFCNHCYDHYKSFEKEIGQLKPSDIFAMLTAKSYATVFRLRFSDQCDIPSQPLYKASNKGHFGEYKNSALAARNTLTKLMAMLRKEIFKAQKVVQEFVEASEQDSRQLVLKDDVDDDDEELI